MLRPLIALVLVLVSLFSHARASSEYSEQLTLRPLPASSLLASFSFVSNTTKSAFEAQNFRHFPRSLGQILQHTHTNELHLRFSSGRWDDERWGDRPWQGYKEGGTGVELWAWIDATTEEEAKGRWLSLTNALSGLYCASLNFIDATRTIRPAVAFERQGKDAPLSSKNLHLLHGTLPAETVCTENLTPFLKALPCKGKAGISSLLDGHKLFDSSWQSMSIDVQPRCPSGRQTCVVEIEQTIDMVLDLERSKRPRDDPIPRPLPVEQLACDPAKYYNAYGDACFPLPGPSSPAFSISQIFGRPIQGACPLAGGDDAVEPLCVEAVKDRNLTANTTAISKQSLHGSRTCFALPKGADFDLDFSEQHELQPLESSSPVTVSRTLTGRGQQHGGFHTVFANTLANDAVKLVYLEPVPWFMKPFLHTMDVTLSRDSNRPTAAPELIEQIYYRPSVDRKRASHLELILTVPAASQVTLSYDFEKSILRYTEYPPDANRGFNAASAIVRILSIAGVPVSKPAYLRTSSLLLYLPTPDFSMPYNVIILSSTVIALAFGSIFNLLVRRFVAADEVPARRGLKSLITSLIEVVAARVTRPKDKTA